MGGGLRIRRLVRSDAPDLAGELDTSSPEVAALGFDERFRRMWRYYLAYSEGAFRAGRVAVKQIILAR